MKEISETDKDLAEQILKLLQAGSGSVHAGDLIIRYESQDGYELGAARADHTDRAVTDKQERVVVDSLRLALRQHTRTGGPVVIWQPTRARTRGTIAGQLFTYWQWQSVPIGRIFNLSPDGHRRAINWITAVSNYEKLDREAWGAGVVAEQQEVLL